MAGVLVGAGAERLPDGALVDEGACLYHAHDLTPFPFSAALSSHSPPAGMSNQNRAHSPFFASAETRPWCSWMMRQVL